MIISTIDMLIMQIAANLQVNEWVDDYQLQKQLSEEPDVPMAPAAPLATPNPQEAMNGNLYGPGGR